MAEVKWIRIPSDFFEKFPMLEDCQERDTLIVVYLKLLFDAFKCNKKGVISIASIDITDDIVSAILRQKYEDIGSKLKVLESLGLIRREQKALHVFKFWEDKRDRNSPAYKEWRSSVFLRDCFRCVECGSMKDIQAHHIKSWKKHKAGRYKVDNGITLCRKCHLKAHGGWWNNG